MDATSRRISRGIPVYMPVLHHLWHALAAYSMSEQCGTDPPDGAALADRTSVWMSLLLHLSRPTR